MFVFMSIFKKFILSLRTTRYTERVSVSVILLWNMYSLQFCYTRLLFIIIIIIIIIIITVTILYKIQDKFHIKQYS